VDTIRKPKTPVYLVMDAAACLWGQWEISGHESKGVCSYLVNQHKSVKENPLVSFSNLFRVVFPPKFKLACRFTRMDGYYF
jgi:hypothetical protein